MAERIIQISYPADKFLDLINGYSASVVGSDFTDGQEINAAQFPQAKGHTSYNAERQTWKPTKVELVHAALLVEIARKAAQGLTQLDTLAAQQTRSAEVNTILESGVAKVTVLDAGA